jgi:4-amino-4-deoxy-L-arabinose transferase-like glycosyltransferase
VHKDFLWLKDKWFWLGNIVALMLILPWHAYEFHLFGSTFIQQYVVWNLLSRTTEAVTVGANTGIGYYIWQYLLLTQPWFIAFFALLSIFLFKRKDMKGKRSYPFMLFTAFSSIGVFILFIIPKTRLLYYFLPALPFMSLYIGTHSSQIIRKYKNVGGIVFGLFAFVGLIHVILTTFSLSDRGFFLESINQVSRDALAQEERNVVEIAAKNKLTLYIYDWNFIATLIYYSQIHNGFEIQRLTDTSQLRSPFLLLIPTPLFVQGISLPIKLDSAYKVSIVYKGPAATLVKFDK